MTSDPNVIIRPRIKPAKVQRAHPVQYAMALGKEHAYREIADDLSAMLERIVNQHDFGLIADYLRDVRRRARDVAGAKR